MRVLRTFKLNADVTATTVIPDFIAKIKNPDALDGAAVRTTHGRLVGRVVDVDLSRLIVGGMTIAWRTEAIAKAASDACLSLVAGPGGGLIIHGSDIDPSVGGIGLVAKAAAATRHASSTRPTMTAANTLEETLRQLASRVGTRLELR